MTAMEKSKNNRYIKTLRNQFQAKSRSITDFRLRDPSWIPPKPKYTINEIIVKARRLNMTYGKYVAMMYERGIQL